MVGKVDEASMANRLTAEFVEVAREVLGLGELRWNGIEEDLRRLAVNNAL